MSKLTVYLACFKTVRSTGLCWEGSLLTQYLEFRMGLKDLSPEDQIVVNEIDRIIEGYYQISPGKPLPITEKGRGLISSIFVPSGYALFHDPNRWSREYFGFQGAR